MLLQRLAIFAVSVNRTSPADVKISWLLEHCILYASELKHEVFFLLEAAYPTAGPEARQELVGQIVRPDLAAKGVSDYEQFNLLTLLVEKNPTCEFAASGLANIRAKHPNYSRREHRDMSHWMQEATWGDPEAGDDKPDIKEWPLSRIVETLEQEKSSMYPGGGAVHASLQTALGESFEWGLELAAQACNADIRNRELWDALLSRWAALDAGHERWSEMLKLLI